MLKCEIDCSIGLFYLAVIWKTSQNFFPSTREAWLQKLCSSTIRKLASGEIFLDFQQRYHLFSIEQMVPGSISYLFDVANHWKLYPGSGRRPQSALIFTSWRQLKQSSHLWCPAPEFTSTFPPKNILIRCFRGAAVVQALVEQEADKRSAWAMAVCMQVVLFLPSSFVIHPYLLFLFCSLFC